MSNPEKRDERSMSDILASIRKIMAQEPGLAMPPNPPRPSLNGVSGAALDMPREPELKLPPEKKPSEGKSPDAQSPPAPPLIGPEPVSLDELLAETPRTAPPPSVTPAAASPTAKPAPGPAGAAPEWLFPKPSAGELAKDEPVSPQAKNTLAKPATEPQAASPAAKAETAEEPKAAAAKEASSPSSAMIGPPAPRLGDLGSVVPGKLSGTGSQPSLAVGPSAPVENGERPVLGPPLAGPLLGEPTRTPAPSEPLQEVPGADALRRLIANVVPPSAHPSFPPVVKAPEPATAKTADAPKVDVAAKPASEAKVEVKGAPTAPLPEAKKPEVFGPAPASPPAPVAAPKPTVAAAPAPKPAAAAPAPAPKPAAPAPAQKAEAPAAEPSAPKPATPPATKTMDETVVELLRPLLREWLDTNMPRLIEPALKAEIEARRDAASKDKKD